MYERPREKMQKRGVSALSNTELLQVIIGSGNAGMPVTKIARKVEKLIKIKGSAVEIKDLTNIPGLGMVKAGQIVASFELAQRISMQTNTLLDETDILADLYADVRSSKNQTLLYIFFDGAGKVIDDHLQTIKPTHITAQLARKLFAEALARSASSVAILIGYQSQNLEPSMFELGLARDAYATARLLSIPIKSFVLVANSGEYLMKEANYG